MKKTVFSILVAFLFLAGCSKPEAILNPGENHLKSGILPSPIGTIENNGILKTGLFYPPATYENPFINWSEYKYSSYKADKYDIMAHFAYYSSVAKSAEIEFTFTNIKYFVPHITNQSEERIYTADNNKEHPSANNGGDQTVITCTANLVVGWNPMFCFIVKVNCDEDQNGLTTIWTDMKVDGVSVKGTLNNYTFKCY